MEQVRLSHCYDKVNIVVYYCAIEVYLHAFTKMELEVNFNVRRIVPQKRKTVPTKYEVLRDSHEGRIGEGKDILHNNGDRKIIVQTVG
jgi:hypothetical protein